MLAKGIHQTNWIALPQYLKFCNLPNFFGGWFLIKMSCEMFSERVRELAKAYQFLHIGEVRSHPVL